MTVTLASWAVAVWIWAYEDLVVGQIPRPSWGDAAYVVSVPALVAAMLLFPSARTWRAQSRVFLDGLILTASFFLIAWLAVVRKIWSDRTSSGLELALALSYPAQDFLMVTLGFLVLLRVDRSLRLTVTLIVVALVCGALADSLGAYSTHSADFTAGPVRSLLSAAAALLFTVALVAAYNADSSISTGETSPSRVTLWLPLVPLLVAGVVVAVAPNEQVLEPPVVLTVVALIVATLVRQVLGAAEAVRREREIRLLAGRLATELDSAARYVASILPGELTGPVHVTSRYLPSRAVGGDSFGYTWLTDDGTEFGHLIVYLIDVSGHGVEPALLSVSVHNLLRSGSLPESTLLEPDRVLAELNGLFGMDSHDGHYFTMWYGVYQLSSGMLRYSSAGHPPVLVLTAEGDRITVSELDGGGSMPVGMFDDTGFSVASYRVPADTRMLLYSDGVLGEPPQPPEFVALCSQWASTPSPTLDSLVDSLPADSTDDADDRSLVLLTFSG